MNGPPKHPEDGAELGTILQQILQEQSAQQQIQCDETRIVKDIEDLIEQKNYQDARAMLDRFSKDQAHLYQLKHIHVLFCQRKAYEYAIDTMEIILEIEPTLQNIRTYIENCYDIYKRKKAVQTITKFKDVLAGEDRTWLLLELADYLFFFDRQYSKAYLMYQDLVESCDAQTVLGVNVLIGKQITEFLLNRTFSQNVFYNALQLLKSTRELQCTPRERSYLLLKLGKLFYHIVKPVMAIQCLYDAHNVDKTYNRPLFMLISLLQLYQRMDLAHQLFYDTPEGHYKTYYSLGVYKQSREQHADAVGFFSRSIAINKNYAKSYYLRGYSRYKLRQFDTALQDFISSLSCDQNQVQVQMYVIYLKQTLGLFDNYEQERSEIAVALDQYLHRTANNQFSINVMKPSDRPPMNLNYYYLWNIPFEQIHKLGQITSMLNKRQNELIIEQEKPKMDIFTFQNLQQQLNLTLQKAIKVGFIIPESVDDLFMQTFGYFFRMFDQQKIMVYLYTMDKINNNCVYQQRLRNEVTVYTSFYQMSAAAAAQKIYQHKINILINMCEPGLNKECQICQLRPAPIQILYFLTPGSSGMKCFDYLIADKYLCPIESHCIYTEQIIMLPRCFASSANHILCKGALLEEERHEFEKPFMANYLVFVQQDVENARSVISHVAARDAAKQGDYFYTGARNIRQELGIPENAFVFATFSQFFKFDPQFLDMIIRLLTICKNAHFLMIQLPPEAVPNIKQYIQIKSQNLLDRVQFLQAHAENRAIERIRRNLAVDVYIDTAKLSGSIILDSLYAGTIVVCQKGAFLGQRITGSYLHQLDLDELICDDLTKLEQKCCALCTDRDYFCRCKRILADNYLRLFNLEQFVGDFTAALQQVYQIWQNGLDPHSFEVLPGR